MSGHADNNDYDDGNDNGIDDEESKRRVLCLQRRVR